MAVDTGGFIASLTTNFIICLVCFIVFSVLRTSKLTRKFYAPKKFADGIRHRPHELPSGFLGWLGPIWNYDEEDLIKVSGLDAAVFIRIIQFGFTIFFWISLWCLVLLIPVNVTDDLVNELLASNKFRKESQRYVYSDIDKISMTNVHQGSSRLWAHTLSVYVVTYIVLKLLWTFNQDLSRLRITFLASQPKGGSSYTALVTDVPGVKAGTVVDCINRTHLLPQFAKDKIINFIELAMGAANGSFITKAHISKATNPPKEQLVTLPGSGLDLDVLYPELAAEAHLRAGKDSKALVAKDFQAVYGTDDVVSVNPVFNQEVLDPLVARYEATKQSLTDLLDSYSSKLDRKKPCKPTMIRVMGPLLGAWGKERYGLKPKKVDALEHYTAYLSELKREIKENEPVAKTDFYPSAFVTFRKRASATIAASSLHSHDETVWRVQEAPGPQEIVWGNLRMRAWERTLRTAAMWALFVVIIMFYAIACAALQGIVNMQQLSKTPVIKDIIKIEVIKSIIQGILPGLVLKIFLAILPKILAAMNRISGMVSISQIDMGVVEKFFIFQFITVFLSTAMAGSVLTQAKAIFSGKQSAGQVVKTIAGSVPQQATFFMTYVLLSGLGEKPIAFLRVVGLVIFWLLSLLAGTERAKARLWAKQEMMFGNTTTDHVMAILFGLVFCIQAPLIAPVCLVYFTVQMFIEKYNAMYVFGRPYESAGRLWEQIYRQIMFIMYVFQLVIILQLGLKGFKATVLLLPVPMITFIYDVTCTLLFRRPWTLLSLRAAAELDRLDHQASSHASDTAGPPADGEEDVATMYLSPAFKINEEEHKALLAETEEINARINGKPAPPAPSSSPKGSPRGSPKAGVTSNPTPASVELTSRDQN